MGKTSITQLARKALLRRGRMLIALRNQTAVIDGDDYLAGLDEVQRHELAEIHGALERIERGIFGRCEECNDKLDAERLQRTPTLRMCGRCDGAPAEPTTEPIVLSEGRA